MFSEASSPNTPLAKAFSLYSSSTCSKDSGVSSSHQRYADSSVVSVQTLQRLERTYDC